VRRNAQHDVSRLRVTAISPVRSSVSRSPCRTDSRPSTATVRMRSSRSPSAGVRVIRAPDDTALASARPGSRRSTPRQ
jgi:hypothetical protein